MATITRHNTLTIQQSFTLHTQHHLLHLHWQWVRELYSCPGLGSQSQPTGSQYLQLWWLWSNGHLFGEHLACSINHQKHSELEVDLVHRERVYDLQSYHHPPYLVARILAENAAINCHGNSLSLSLVYFLCHLHSLHLLQYL